MGGEQKKESSTSGSAIRTKTKEISFKEPDSFNSHAPPKEDRKKYIESKVDLYLSIKGKKLPDLSQLVPHNLETFKTVRYVIVGELQKYNLAALSGEPDDDSMVLHQRAALEQEAQFFIDNRTSFVRPIVCELGVALNIPMINRLSDDNDKHQAIKQNIATALAEIESQFNLPFYGAVSKQIELINQCAKGRFEIIRWNTFLEQPCIGNEGKECSLEDMASTSLEHCKQNNKFKNIFENSSDNPARRYLDNVLKETDKKDARAIRKKLKDSNGLNMQRANYFVMFEAAVFASVVFLKEKPDYHAYAGSLSSPIFIAFEAVYYAFSQINSVPFIQMEVPAPKKPSNNSTNTPDSKGANFVHKASSGQSHHLKSSPLKDTAFEQQRYRYELIKSIMSASLVLKVPLCRIGEIFQASCFGQEDFSQNEFMTSLIGSALELGIDSSQIGEMLQPFFKDPSHISSATDPDDEELASSPDNGIGELILGGSPKKEHILDRSNLSPGFFQSGNFVGDQGEIEEFLEGERRGRETGGSGKDTGREQPGAPLFFSAVKQDGLVKPSNEKFTTTPSSSLIS